MKTNSIKTIGMSAIIWLVVFGQIQFAAIAIGSDQTNEASFLSRLQRLEALNDQERIMLLKSGGQQLHQIQEILLNKLASKNEDVKCCAAYLLGEYRFHLAVSSLAKNIGLEFSRPTFAESLWDTYPAKEALIKIGAPSIPFVVGNLAESNDAKVRELSLQVLYRIDGDKDISQLRLQKALKAEKDSAKQARLQAALKALSEIKTQ